MSESDIQLWRNHLKAQVSRCVERCENWESANWIKRVIIRRTPVWDPNKLFETLKFEIATPNKTLKF